MVIRVVIADDHTLIREGTRSFLQQDEDIEVVGEATDGAEAVRMVVELRPDVALVDISMPFINGVEVARRIRALSPATAVMALSIYDDDAYVFAALEAGASGYVLKNCSSEELVAAVKTVHAGGVVLSPWVAQKVLGRGVEPSPVDTDGSSWEALSEREREVLQMTARGLTNKAIAREMSLSPRTVQIHLAHSFRKLGVASRTEAVSVCLRKGWLQMEDTG